MVGVLAVGFIANLLVRPVAERYQLSQEGERAEQRGKRAQTRVGDPGREDRMSTPEHTATPNGASSSTTLAYILWALVILSLAYGVFKTGDTALALAVYES